MVSEIVALSTAERVSETLRLHGDMLALWPGQFVSVGVFYPSHEIIHEAAAAGSQVIATKSQDRWCVSAGLANYGTNPKLYADADLDCLTCQQLIAETEARESARAGGQP